MSVVTWPDHFLTLHEWDDLPEDNRFRREVVEGVLIVSPRPMTFHLRAVTRLSHLIDGQLPDSLSALSEPDVVVTEHPLTVRSPDVIVTGSKLADSNPPRYRVEDLLLAVEVLSEGSVRTDRVMKFSEYAEAGIPNYWLVDPDTPTTLTTFRLAGIGYEMVGRHTGLTTVDLDGTPITLDLGALTASRAQKL
ncbi:MAG TPA: Uma2 family endonuclease [Pseudonocardiaceae bacterium]|nr:Uma2 family endonuclease [Pseudonocardiaceae bacterium]